MSWKSMTWKQKGLGVVAVGFGLVLLVGLGVYGYVLALDYIGHAIATAKQER